jgi:hypothetical protein
LLYPTSLPCNSSRHDEYLRAICCCYQWCDSAVILTIYASIVSNQVMKPFLVHSSGH